MTQAEKIAKIEELFAEMEKVMPECPMGLTIHNIDFDELPAGYEVHESKFAGMQQKKYAVSTLGQKDNYREVCLFEKVKEKKV